MRKVCGGPEYGHTCTVGNGLPQRGGIAPEPPGCCRPGAPNPSCCKKKPIPASCCLPPVHHDDDHDDDHDDEAGDSSSLHDDSRGFTCLGNHSGLLFSKDPYHNTDCDHLNQRAGSGWVCTGQVYPGHCSFPGCKALGEKWVTSLNAIFKNRTKFYLYDRSSQGTEFYYLASHACSGRDNVTLNNWLYGPV